MIRFDVDALQVTPDSVDRAVAWSGGRKVTEIDPHDSSVKFVALNIPTLEGIKRAQENDFIVKWPDGHLEVQSAGEFLSKFERVD